MLYLNHPAVAEHQPEAFGPKQNRDMITEDSFLKLASATRSLIQDGFLSDDSFNRAALELFAFQFENVSVIRSLAESRGLSPGGLDHWSQIPAIPASSFKEFDVTTLPEGGRSHVFHSSGTTGSKRSSHFHSDESLMVYEAALVAGFDAMVSPLLPKETCVVSLTPPSAAVPTSSLVHMFEVLGSRIALGSLTECSAFHGEVDQYGAWALDVDACAKGLKEDIALGRPVLLLGTAFSFVHLCDALQVPLVLPPCSLALETGGYKGQARELGKAELHALISSSLGICRDRIVCEYGMSELSSQAYDVGSRGLASDERSFEFPNWVRVRLVSPEHGGEVAVGEMGLIQIFDLANVASSIAVQTEDLAVRLKRGFRLIGRTVRSEPKGCSLMNL